MKKTILCLTLGSFLATANSLTVKDADVNATINSESKVLKKGVTLELKEGSNICFKSGKGRMVINNIRQLSAKSEISCILLEVKKGFEFTKWVKNKTKTIGMLFVESNEEVKSGVSKGVDDSNSSQRNYIIPTDKKEMLIYSDSFGPLPVTLSVKDTNGEVVQSFVNEESDKSMFRVGVESVDANYTLEVTNAFGNVLLDVRFVEE